MSEHHAFHQITFDNSYAGLPAQFYTAIRPTPVFLPSLISVNESLAASLGLRVNDLSAQKNIDIFSGNTVLPDCTPLALVYAGHQFGQFVPQLGDGRAHLLGELIDKKGMRFDIQLKGSGLTPYSRRGDGRAAIGPVIREYIVSEAMHALGIPTTRSLAAVTTGETVARERPLPGAILTRIAKSHIRVGTFEYFAARGDMNSVKVLSDYVIWRHYPDIKESNHPYLSLLEAISDVQAKLIANWMHVGFIHGVMNTDNMSVSGETIDYGPCAFLDNYEEEKVFSAIDRGGRYAYGRQGLMGQWNIARLAEALLPLIDDNEEKAYQKANEVIQSFEKKYQHYWISGIRKKLGLLTEIKDDGLLIDSLFSLMEKNALDFTNTFNTLTKAMIKNDSSDFICLGKDLEEISAWEKAWRLRLKRESVSNASRKEMMRQANPIYIPRNHLIEKTIQAAIHDEDYSLMHTLGEVLSKPYTEQEKYVSFSLPPKDNERVYQTFCGT